MSCYSRPKSPREITIAIICALVHEAEAVEAVFDEFYGEDDGDDTLAQDSRDNNIYTTGRIGKHYVALVHMAGAGKLNAAAVTCHLSLTFPNIQLALVVGVCGGIPCTQDGGDIFLGDVIVSTNLVLYDEYAFRSAIEFNTGRIYQSDRVRSSRQVQALLAKLQSNRNRRRLISNLKANLVCAQNFLGQARFEYPGAEHDRLFPSSYPHQHPDHVGCTICSRGPGEERSICRHALDTICDQLGCTEDIMNLQRTRVGLVESTSVIPQPEVYMGPIATGDTVVMCGSKRDEMHGAHGILGFEMEAAGVCDQFPCVVIKGVSDYADCHKSKMWQNYAAATAASCMKAFLHEYPAQPLGTLLRDTEPIPAMPPGTAVQASTAITSSKITYFNLLTELLLPFKPLEPQQPAQTTDKDASKSIEDIDGLRRSPSQEPEDNAI